VQLDRKIVAVKFGSSERTYDYEATGFDVSVGQKVIIPMRGREVSVEVVEVKAESELAKVAILRIAEPETAPEIAP
jgi:primosomal protein N'